MSIVAKSAGWDDLIETVPFSIANDDIITVSAFPEHGDVIPFAKSLDVKNALMADEAARFLRLRSRQAGRPRYSGVRQDFLRTV